MKTINATNVNEAFPQGVYLIKSQGVKIESRYGVTLEVSQPVATRFEKPCERVLFSAVRDANPFFHVMEALWILAGREDVKFLEVFNSRMKEFSDDGVKFHAPYGHRLRNHFGVDQIELAVQKLSEDHDTRRVVMMIWDPVVDLPYTGKDMPCNDGIALKIRNGALEMRVWNRSNDMLWGTYGANVVQFSTLQEYLAARIGVGVGAYTQISDSYHVYTSGEGGKLWESLPSHMVNDDPYSRGETEYFPLVAEGEPLAEFGSDLVKFFEWFDEEDECPLVNPDMFTSDYFINIVYPIYNAWICRKSLKDEERANAYLSAMVDCDWKRACQEWIARRVK